MKKLRSLTIILMVSLVAVLAFGLLLERFADSDLVTISDIDYYGYYTGSGMDEFANEFIHSFFPAEIEDYFSSVSYCYKAGGNNTYGFEAYLEFTIADDAVFYRYISEIGDDESWKAFSFDAQFKVLDFDDRFDLNEEADFDPESDYHYPIERAKIRRVLYNEETHTIIFWALGVYDGGGIGTNFLNSFFERFNIDPVAYALSADSPYGADPYEID